MSGKEPRHSQPNWATLTDAGSVATSEDDILESSQDMRDELMDTSPEGSRAGSQQPRKRTASNSASASFGGNTHKRRKTSGGSVPVGFGIVDADDRPASAHAKPTRMPSVQPRRTSLSHSAASASSLAAGLSEFERRRGGLPVPSSSKPSTSSGNKPPDFTQRFKDISVNVARKKTGKGKGKGKGPAPRQSTLAFEIIPSPTKNKSPQKKSKGSSFDALSSSDEDLPSTPRELLAARMKSQSTSSLLDKGKKPLIAERRKTISNDDILDLTLDTSSDKETQIPSPRKPASVSSFRRAVGPIQPKSFELRGNVDDPIVLSSDDEEPPAAAPPRASSHMAHTSPKLMPVTEPEQDDAPMSMSPEPLPPKPMEHRLITPPPPVYSPPKQAPATTSPAVSTSQESTSLPIAFTPNPEPVASGSRLPALASPSPTTSTATVPVPIPRTSRKGRSVMRGHFFKGVFDRQQSSAAKSTTSPPLPSSSQPRKPTVHKRQTQSPQSPQSSSEHASNVLVSSAQASAPSSVPVSAMPSAAASSAASSQSALGSPVAPAETDEAVQQGAPIEGAAPISARTPSPEPPAPQSPTKPLSSKSPNKGFTTELSKKIAEVQVNHAMQMGLFIDLTQSDTEGSERMDLSDREASPEAIESARRLAEVAPELMDFDIPQHIGPLAPRDPSPPKETIQTTAPSEPAAAGPSSGAVAPSPLDFIRKLTAGKRPAAQVPPTSTSVPAPPVKPLHPKPRIPAIIRPESREREEEEVNMLLEGVQEGEDSEYTNEEQNDADEDEVEEAPSSDDIRSRLRSRVRQADLLPSPTWSSDSDSSDRPLAQRPRTRGGPTDTLVPRLSVMALDNSSDSDEFTWEKDGKRWAKEHASIYMRARDLDFNLQDRMTALSIDARRGDDMQRVAFESIISVGTAEDEPFAPNIEIRNSIDDELSPPFEFHYTNKMWHSDNVPPPDVENLQGCDCIGRCDPNSKTCACVQRQAPYMPLGQKGFAYDKFGRIRKQVHGQMPIFECNALCKCDDDLCQNRVVQRGRTVHINIEKTAEKGWGVFAGEKIKAHTFLGIYAGEFLTNSEGDARGTIYDAFGRTYLFDIDFYWMKKDWKPECQQTGDEVPKSQSSKDQDSDDDDDDGVKYCVDAYHAGNFTRYLNHSCDPNCNIVPVFINEANMDKPLLTIFTLREVAAGEELCFSYFGEMDDDEKPEDDERALDAAVHAPCRCGAARCRGRMWK